MCVCGGVVVAVEGKDMGSPAQEGQTAKDMCLDCTGHRVWRQ